MHESELGVESNDGPGSVHVSDYFNLDLAAKVVGEKYRQKAMESPQAKANRDDLERWGKQPTTPFKPIKVAIPKRKKDNPFNILP